MEKNIANRACVDKRRHAQTLPKNGVLHAQKVELAGQWLADFDTYVQHAYYTATSETHTLERLLHHAAPEALTTAQELGVLATFPFRARDAGYSTRFDYLSGHADGLAVRMDAALKSSDDIIGKLPLLRFFALRLLHAEHAIFADLLKEAAFFAQGDEQARNDTPMFYSLFEMFLEHTGRADELRADGLLISEVLLGDVEERTPTYFAGCFEETFIRLVDEKLDRLAVVARTLPRHKRPDITEEQVKADHTLGLVLRSWEREHAPVLLVLQAEKEQLEQWLATPHLELVYWWARDVEEGLDDCAWAKQSIALALDYWKQEGVADDGITVDAIWEELFKLEGE